MKACVSMFSQMLAMVKRPVFERIVRTHQAEARSKGFSSWVCQRASAVARL